MEKIFMVLITLYTADGVHSTEVVESGLSGVECINSMISLADDLKANEVVSCEFDTYEYNPHFEAEQLQQP